MVRWLAIAASLIAGCCAACSAGDYTVTRSATVTSQRPIWILIVETGTGVLDGNWESVRNTTIRADATIESTYLAIDGRPATGIRGMASAAWRLVGFVIWGADGTVERTTEGSYRGRSVRIVDGASDGRVWLRVVVGPPLGDPRVRYAVLELVANENESQLSIYRRHRTTVAMECAVLVDLPGDNCGLVRRFARRIADREAGTELSARVNELLRVGSEFTYAGRQRLIETFLERTCR